MKHTVCSALLFLLAAGSQVLAADPPQPDSPANTPASQSPASACTLSPVRLADPNAFYPASERSAGHKGRVIVEFTIPQSGAKPVDLRVAESSSYPALDAAALVVVEKSRFKTTCPGTSTKLAVKFGS